MRYVTCRANHLHCRSLFLKLLDFLCIQHIDYAVAIAAEELPPRKVSRSDVNVNTIPSIAAAENRAVAGVPSRGARHQQHLLSAAKALLGRCAAVRPVRRRGCCVSVTALRPSVIIYPKCVHKKNEVMERVESQMALGVERMLDAIVDWTRSLLARVCAAT